MSDLFVYYGKSNTKYPAVECTCAMCGKSFLKGTRWLSRTPVHTCSKECSQKYHTLQKQLDKQHQLDTWLAEKHVCSTCGKVMTTFYGSGKFCSRACANSRTHSEDTKSKIAGTQAKLMRQQYEAVPKKCTVCDGNIPYEKRHRQTCSKACYRALVALKAKANGLGGLTNGCGTYSKHGKYKGIKCDSTYELVFLIYCLDHNIPIIRNTKYFIYTFNNKERKYYPDFYLPDANLYVELKGFKDTKVDIKLQSVKDSGNNISIYFKQDLLPCFEYVGNTYNKKANPDYNNLEELYDKN